MIEIWRELIDQTGGLIFLQLIALLFMFLTNVIFITQICCTYKKKDYKKAFWLLFANVINIIFLIYIIGGILNEIVLIIAP